MQKTHENVEIYKWLLMHKHKHAFENKLFIAFSLVIKRGEVSFLRRGEK